MSDMTCTKVRASQPPDTAGRFSSQSALHRWSTPTRCAHSDRTHLERRERGSLHDKQCGERPGEIDRTTRQCQGEQVGDHGRCGQPDHVDDRGAQPARNVSPSHWPSGPREAGQTLPPDIAERRLDHAHSGRLSLIGHLCQPNPEDPHTHAALVGNLRLRSLLALCTRCNQCRPPETNVYVGFIRSRGAPS